MKSINKSENMNFKEIYIEDIILKNFNRLDMQMIEIIRKYRNHPEVRKWMYSDKPISKKEHLKFIKSLKKDRKNLYFLAIRNGQNLGVLSFRRIDTKNRNAYFGIYANPEEKIKDAGKLLGETLLKFAFEYLKLHTLKLEVLEINERAIKFYERLGFKREGILREFAKKGNKWLNVLIMGLTEDEYFTNKALK